MYLTPLYHGPATVLCLDVVVYTQQERPGVQALFYCMSNLITFIHEREHVCERWVPRHGLRSMLSTGGRQLQGVLHGLGRTLESGLFLLSTHRQVPRP